MSNYFDLLFSERIVSSWNNLPESVDLGLSLSLLALEETCRFGKSSQLVLANFVLLYYCDEIIGQMLEHFVPFCHARLHLSLIHI